MVTDNVSWRDARDDAVWGRFGIASLAGTHWLDHLPREFDGVPGLWHADGRAVIGTDLGATAFASPAGDTVTLAGGQSIVIGDLQLRAFARDGSQALRVLDPGAPARRGISRIERAPIDPAAAVAGRFRPAALDSAADSVDGRRTEVTYAGVVMLRLDGHDLELTVERLDDGSLFGAFSDSTSGTQSYRFRFLRLPAPAADGSVVVDLNRAYLPPCAFSDHYACVFPPAGNRWSVAVRTGELQVL